MCVLQVNDAPWNPPLVFRDDGVVVGCGRLGRCLSEQTGAAVPAAGVVPELLLPATTQICCWRRGLWLAAAGLAMASHAVVGLAGP